MEHDHDLRLLRDARVEPMPWYFRLGRYLSRHRIRGGYRLVAEARRRGLLDQLVLYSIGNIKLRVPLWRPCNDWLEDDVRNYEAMFMRVLADVVCALPGKVTLVDCGADIGTVSALLVSRCANIQRVVALEPNPAAYHILTENLGLLPIQAEAHQAAVGDFTGRGRLVRSEHDASAHAMYVTPDHHGAVSVIRIDDLPQARSDSLVVKIDVEGTEAEVVAGAAHAIRNAGNVVVAFEANRAVAERRGRDPIEVMSALRAIRDDFVFTVDMMPTRRLDPERRIFDQLPPKRVYNVIAASTSRAGK